MPDNAISTRELTKVFGHFTAVDNLNLDISAGELFGLLGPNGAGKTTSVRMLSTLLEPTRGTATVAGYDITREPAKVRREIGVVSEGIMLYKDLTVEENLRFLGTLYGLAKSVAENRVEELLGMFAFKEKAKRLVSGLSTGWAKKAMISAALLHNPKILFLDEVTSGLDPQSAIALRDFTKRLCDQGVTVIWTTHYMEEPEKICDRVGVMFAGRLVQVGTPNELKHSANKVTVLEVDTPRLPAERIDRIRKLSDVVKVAYEDPILRITGSREDGFIEDVTDTLRAIGAKIRAINTKEPTLEEAFISLTGGEDEIDRFLEIASRTK